MVSRGSRIKGKQFANVRLAGLASVFADFKGLRKLHGAAFFFTVVLHQHLAKAVGLAALPLFPNAAQPLLSAGLIRRWWHDLCQLLAAVRATLIVLGGHFVDGGQLLVEHVIE